MAKLQNNIAVKTGRKEQNEASEVLEALVETTQLYLLDDIVELSAAAAS